MKGDVLSFDTLVRAASAWGLAAFAKYPRLYIDSTSASPPASLNARGTGAPVLKSDRLGESFPTDIIVTQRPLKRTECGWMKSVVLSLMLSYAPLGISLAAFAKYPLVMHLFFIR